MVRVVNADSWVVAVIDFVDPSTWVVRDADAQCVHASGVSVVSLSLMEADAVVTTRADYTERVPGVSGCSRTLGEKLASRER